MRVYLDVCCLSRPFDDQTQVRIRLEAEAVIAVFAACRRERLTWISSDAVTAEASRNRDRGKRDRVLALALAADERVTLAATDFARASQMEAAGFGAFDALHIACAERGGADVLLTTDDRFVKLAARHSALLRITVVNPLQWVQEVSL